MDTNMEFIKEMELKFRNKIIELEKQLQFENLRASQYQTKFREAVMDNSLKKGDQQLLAKLTEKQSQIYQLRRQLQDANRKLNEPNNYGDVDELMNQNQEMRNVVQQLKNAAIAAIMEKDNEIQMLKRQIIEMDFAQQVSELSERNMELENHMQIKVAQYEQEIKKLNQKLALERDGFSEKLSYLHKEFSHQQNQKQMLIEKAQNLEGNLENLEKVIEKYEARISEIQHVRSSEKINFTKTEYQMQRRIENLMEDIKHIEKNQQKLQENIITLHKTIEQQNKKIDLVNQEKQELDRKLKIKNRKNNAKQITNSIFESFEGFSKKADVYASFAKRQNRDVTKQSFAGEPIKLSDIKEIEIEEIENFDIHMHDINEISHHKKKDSVSVEEAKSNVYSAKTESQTQAKVDSSHTRGKTEELQQKIKSLLNQIDECNKIIESITKQLQKQRQDKLELKMKNSTQQSQFKVQKQSLRLHVYKLENALLIEKLQNAEKLESNKQIRDYQKKLFEDQIKKLKTELENSKKKKGFFG